MRQVTIMAPQNINRPSADTNMIAVKKMLTWFRRAIGIKILLGKFLYVIPASVWTMSDLSDI